MSTLAKFNGNRQLGLFLRNIQIYDRGRQSFKAFTQIALLKITANQATHLVDALSTVDKNYEIVLELY